MVVNVFMLIWSNILKEMNVYEYSTLQFKFAVDKSYYLVFDTLLLSEIPVKFIAVGIVKLQWRIQLRDGTPPPHENS
jgi:hypothetical protein